VTPLTIGRGAPLSVIALGAHADDIEIGAGGLLLELLAAGRVADLTWVVLSGDAGRAEEARASATALVDGRAPLAIQVHDFRERYLPHDPAIKEAFDELGGRLDARPDLVIAPRLEDRHQDHRVVAELAWQSFRGSLIVEYEVPKWEGDLGNPNLFVPLAAETLERKIEHLMAAFPSQLGRSWFTADTFRGLARLRGIEAASPTGYAEGFTCRKAILGI
jgi:LmbE family N-acetylglucosaminyl deacetylase